MGENFFPLPFGASAWRPGGRTAAGGGRCRLDTSEFSRSNSLLLLVVDDNLPSRYATVRLLSSAGYDVREAATGAEALRLARFDADLVLLDLRLPDLNGFDVCVRLKGDRRTAAVPVVMKTAVYGAEDDRRRGFACGASEYLTEPVPPTALVAIVSRLLRRRTSHP
ncbi:MAG: response regulator [Candidatus Rokuibacteriota bacterium]